jgi:integrase
VRLEHDVTLAEFIEDYWRAHAVPNLEPQTRRNYRQQWGKHILPRLGEYELRAINAAGIPARARRADASRRRRRPDAAAGLAVLQAIFAHAVTTDRVTDNPVSRVAKPRQPGGREVPPVPPATVEQLRARLGPADALMVSVLAYAGLRPQELLALQWNDIHERAILVRRKNVDGQLYPYTKTRTNRRVKLLAPLAADLREWKLTTGRRDGLVVPRTDGTAVARSRLPQLAPTGLQAARRRGRADVRRAVQPARLVRVAAGLGGSDDA